MAYLLMGVAGILAFMAASTSLLEQGGRIIAIVWGGVALTSSLLGLVGIVFGKVVIELFGAGCAATATLTWTVSLLLQANSKDNAIPLTAASMAGVLTLLLLQRWVDAGRPRE